jgi:hypothetical protein
MGSISAACYGGTKTWAIELYAFLFFRQASEQNRTSAQCLAHRFLQTIVRPHTAQILLGKVALLPLKKPFDNFR